MWRSSRGVNTFAIHCSCEPEGGIVEGIVIISYYFLMNLMVLTVAQQSHYFPVLTKTIRLCAYRKFTIIVILLLLLVAVVFLVFCSPRPS